MLLALEHAEEALVDADVLLLRLHHPHPLLPHLVHDAVNVNNIIFPDALESKKKGKISVLPSSGCPGVNIVIMCDRIKA